MCQRPFSLSWVSGASMLQTGENAFVVSFRGVCQFPPERSLFVAGRGAGLQEARHISRAFLRRGSAIRRAQRRPGLLARPPGQRGSPGGDVQSLRLRRDAPRLRLGRAVRLLPREPHHREAPSFKGPQGAAPEGALPPKQPRRRGMTLMRGVGRIMPTVAIPCRLRYRVAASCACVT